MCLFSPPPPTIAVAAVASVRMWEEEDALGQKMNEEMRQKKRRGVWGERRRGGGDQIGAFFLSSPPRPLLPRGERMGMEGRRVERVSQPEIFGIPLCVLLLFLCALLCCPGFPLPSFLALFSHGCRWKCTIFFSLLPQSSRCDISQIFPSENGGYLVDFFLSLTKTFTFFSI